MPNRVLIIITVVGTIVLVILVSTIWYLKYYKARGKVRHFLAKLRGKNDTPSPATYQQQALNG